MSKPKPKPKSKSKWSIPLLLIVLTLFKIGCSPSTPTEPLKVGITPWPGYDVIYYAQSAGLFEKHGLDVKLLRYDNLEDSNRAIVRGKLDAVFSSIWDATQLPVSDNSPEIVLITNVSHGSDGIVARQGIESVRDLAGKTVSCQVGIINHVILAEALKQSGVNPDDVTIKDVDNNTGEQMLKAGEVDAAVLWEPNLSSVAKQIDGKVIFDTSDVDSHVVDNLLAAADLPPEKQAQLQLFIDIWFEVMRELDSNPDDVFAGVATELNQSAEAFQMDYAGLKRGDMALNKRMFDGHITDITDSLAELMLPHVSRMNTDLTLNDAYIKASTQR